MNLMASLFEAPLQCILLLLVFSSISIRSDAITTLPEECSLNGVYNPYTFSCECNKGWKGDTCGVIALAPAPHTARDISPGVAIPGVPTWGGGAMYEDERWHLIVGSRAVNMHNNTLEDYQCDSRIIRVTSVGDDPLGPYTVAETVFPRSSWEPGLAKNPLTGELVVMFFGNISNPPPVGSDACVYKSGEYNITTTNTFISVSKSGSIKGPWSAPLMVKGMINQPGRVSGYDWNCASSNPSPAFHPNGTLYAALRHNPCWSGFKTRENIGIWRADHGWDGEWTSLTDQPVYGWGGGSQEKCLDDNLCPAHEDPHLWWDDRGAHLLTHSKNNEAIHMLRGAYGWSKDGLNWHLETEPLLSNTSAWEMNLQWSNGSMTKMARRQRPSFISDPMTGQLTHLINGADFTSHPGPTGWCEGCHWGTGVTLIQRLL